MKQYIAVVASDAGRVTKYQDFDVEAYAMNHVFDHGGFVVLTPSTGSIAYWAVDPVAETLTYDSVAELAEDTQRYILAEILRLENLETPRRKSEAILGTPIANDLVYPTATTGTEWLQANRDAIAFERTSL